MASVSVIEDETMFVKIIRSALERLEHSARFYADGSSGLAGLQLHPPDLLILDLNLPDADGIDIAKTIREHEQLNTMPILMLTARTDLDSRVLGLQFADDYLGKPFEMEELAARVQALLRRSFNAQSLQADALDVYELTGKRIKHYDLFEVLGEGSMSIVYKALDTWLGRAVAMKFITNPFSDDTIRERFLREAKAASRLEHENICPVFVIDELPSSEMFIVMPFFEGRTLEAMLAHETISTTQACDYAIQIASGLALAHSKNIIHRDIKPGNIFITFDGTVKLLDFGIAKLLNRSVDANLTQPGTILGTVNYMAPEQVRAQNIGVAADCWSLGVVLYEMLARKLPFEVERQDLIGTISKIMRGEHISLDQVKPKLPKSLVEITNKALQKDPADRYHTMAGMIHDLENVKRALL
ncbi:MAG: protein kinase [Deinococcota bacterium]